MIRPCNQRRVEAAAATFENKAVKIHGKKYDYSRVVYKNCKTKVEIRCPRHGIFLQKPNGHLSGNGCPVCKNNVVLDITRRRVERTIPILQKKFVERATLVHNNKYDYSRSVYKNAHTPVVIICPDHGEFGQLPINHYAGRGCPKCGRARLIGGYASVPLSRLRGKQGSFYVVEISDTTTSPATTFLKIGISVQPIHLRLSELKKQQFSFQMLVQRKMSLDQAFLLEQLIRTQLKAVRYHPTRKFRGHTECFHMEALDSILEML